VKLLLDLYDRHPFGIGMIGIGSGLSASAISFLQQLDLIIRVTGGFVALLVGISVLILQGHKVYCLVRKWLHGPVLIAAAAVAALMMTGCAALRPVPIPSTGAVTGELDSTQESLHSAQGDHNRVDHKGIRALDYF